MPERLWYPTLLIDDVLPEGRKSPEAWLDFLHMSLDDRDECEDILARHFTAGDQIRFQWCENHGTMTLAIDRNGNLSQPVRCQKTADMFDGTVASAQVGDTIPAGINSFWHYDTESFGETAEEFAVDFAANAGSHGFDDGDPVDVEVDVAVWSETLTFLISADGRSLTPVTTGDTHDQA